MYFLSRNHITDSEVSLLSGTENASFPASNIKHPFTTKTFRSVGNSVELLIDLGSSLPCDTFALVGSNVNGIGFTSIELKGSATTDFSGSTAILPEISHEYNFGYATFNEVPFRYWKVTLSATGGYCELANIFLGNRVEMATNGISTDSFTLAYNDNSTTKLNSRGQKFIDKQNTVKVMTGEVQVANYDETKLLEELYAFHRTHTPLWVIMDVNSIMGVDGNFKYSGYFYLGSDFVQQAISVGLFNIKLDLREAV